MQHDEIGGGGKSARINARGRRPAPTLPDSSPDALTAVSTEDLDEVRRIMHDHLTSK